MGLFSVTEQTKAKTTKILGTSIKTKAATFSEIQENLSSDRIF